MQVSEQRQPYASRVQQPLILNQPPIMASQQPIFLNGSRATQFYTQPPNYIQQSFVAPPAPGQPIPFSKLPPILYPQYQQPLYPPGQPYLHPQFIAQPVTVVRRPPTDLPPAPAQPEKVNQLCEAKLVEDTIFCVVCGTEYKTSEKEQHIQKHTRKQEKTLNQEALHRLEEYHKKETKQGYMVKPIVEPEEVDVPYDPNVFEIIQEIIYEDESMIAKKEEAAGQEANNSFNVFDNNVSISHNQPPALPAFDSEPNPFFSRHEQPHEYHVPGFEIPPPPLNAEQDQPLIYQEEPHLPGITSSKLQQPVQQEEPHIPIANTLNTYPADVTHLIEEVKRPQPRLNQRPQFDLPSQRIPQVYSSQQPQSKTRLADLPEYHSQRFNSGEYKGCPPEEPEKIETIEKNEPHESFSGPFEVRAPNEQSKKSTEVNVSQFIRDLNAENEGLVLEDRRRIANQSEW